MNKTTPPSKANPPTTPPARSSDSESGGRLGAVVLHHTVTALMLAMIIALGAWSYLTFRQTSFFSAPDTADSEVEAHAIDAQRQRIRFALKVYRRLTDRYPPDLAELTKRGLLAPSDLYYPPGRGRYVYGRSDDTYSLEWHASETP